MASGSAGVPAGILRPQTPARAAHARGAQRQISWVCRLSGPRLIYALGLLVFVRCRRGRRRYQTRPDGV